MKFFKIVVFIITLCFFAKSNAQFMQNSEKQIVIGTVDSLYSKTLKEQREVWVHLPAEGKEGEKYPVLYILDASEQFSTVSGIVRHLEKWDMPQTIVVGIENTDRIRDFTPTAVSPSPGAPFETSGGYKNFIKFMEHELAPYLKNKYPIDEMSTIVGHSTAGLFVVSTYITHPHVFDKYIAIDPNLSWDDQTLMTTSKKLLQKDSYQNKSLHITVANSYEVDTLKVRRMKSKHTEHLRANLNFHDILVENSKHLDVTWKFYPDDDHRSLIIPSMYSGLKNIFSWYRFEERWRFNTPKKFSKKELTEPYYTHFETLSTHFKRDMKPEWEFVNEVALFILEVHKLPKKAKAYFEMNVHFYPDESRSYVALGNYYESQKDEPEAIEYYNKAIEIDSNEDAKARLRQLKN